MLIGGSVSLDEQVRQCRDAAVRLGLEVAAELVEKPSTSGYKQRGRGRAKFKELLELVRTGRVDCVIAYKTDRLSRGGGPGWAPLPEAFEQAGRDLDRAVATPGGWVSEFELGIRATVDREESKKTSERMRAVRAREAREGKPRPSGQRGLGYSTDWMTIDDEEAALVRGAVERVLAGESVYAVATDWNRRGIPTVNGKQWSVSVLTTILRSPRIAGLREHNGSVVAEGSWPAIVDRQSHEQLRVVLAPKHRRGPEAGSTPGGNPALRPVWRPPALAHPGERHRYLRLSPPSRPRRMRPLRIKAEPVEVHVKELVLGMLADPRTREVLVALQPEETDDDAVSVGRRIRDIESCRERPVDLYLGGDLDKAAYRRRVRDLDAELAAAEALFADRASRRTLVGIPSDYQALEELWSSKGIEFQRLLIEAVLEPITVKPAAARGRKRFDPERLAIVPRA